MAMVGGIDKSAASDKSVQVLQGAMQEFLQHGYAGTSMDRVAATAGVSKPTVYSHFRDKEGLFKALVQYVAQERCQRVMGEEPLQGDPAVILRELAITSLTEVLNDPTYLNFVRLVIGESGRFPQLAHTFLENLTKPSLERLSQYLAQQPDLDIPDPDATAHILLGSVVFFMLTQGILDGAELLPMEPERMVDAVMHLLVGRRKEEGGG